MESFKLHFKDNTKGIICFVGVFSMFNIFIWDASLPKRNHTFLRHEKSCSWSASSFSTLKSVHKIGYFLNKWNCRDMTWIVIFVTFIWYLWTKMNWLWIMLKTFIWIISRNMLFIQKYPQFSQKMSASNACLLATFFHVWIDGKTKKAKAPINTSAV